MLPDVESCRVVVEELGKEGVTDQDMHAVAGLGVDLEGLPQAGLMQKTEFAHGLEAGIGVGGVAGFLGGLLAVTFPPAGLVLGGGALLAGALAGAGFGALVASLVAKDMPSHELEKFEAGIAEGGILLLVDVPRNRVDEFTKLVKEHHPEAEIGVTTPPRR
jgi:hypothetical protein